MAGKEFGQGAEMIRKLRESATGFDEQYKVFIAWCRYQEMKQRRKSGDMGKGFDMSDKGGDGDDGGEL